MHFMCLWPLYLVGYYSADNDALYGSIKILLHKGFIDSVVAPTYRMTVEVQNRYIPVSEAGNRVACAGK